MSSCFAVTERRPHTPAFAASRPAMRNKCTCGGQCSACRAKQNHGTKITYNFRDIKIHPHELARITARALPARLSETENGDTSCDVSNGVPDITLNKPSICNRDCTARHEAVHKKDISSCCSKAHTAWTNAKDDKKDAVQDKMNKWVEENRYWLECRAYAESVKCATEWLAANCGSKRTDAAEGAPVPAATEGMGDFPINDVPPSGGQNSVPPSALAEEKFSGPEKPVQDEPKIEPTRCCDTVRDYRFHAKARGDAYCNGAKKNLTPCPF